MGQIPSEWIVLERGEIAKWILPSPFRPQIWQGYNRGTTCDDRMQKEGKVAVESASNRDANICDKTNLAYNQL